MDKLITLQNEIVKLSDQEDDLIDAYYRLTMQFNLKSITDCLTIRQRRILLTKSGLSPHDIKFFDKFDNYNYQNTIEYIIGLSRYDSIKSRVFAFLFSTLSNKSRELTNSIELLLQ